MSVIIKSGSSGNLADVLADKSIPVTIQNAGVPVSGSVAVTNFPVTQPVSGTVTANVGTTGGLALDATLTAGTQKTKLVDTAGVNVAVVDAAGDLQVDVNNFPATQPISAVALPLPTNAAQETGGNLAAIATAMTNGTAKTQTVSGTGTVQDVTAKAVQGANFAAVQQPKDSGRVLKNFSAAFSATTTEAMITLTPITDGAAGTPATTFAVTAGKRLRLGAMAISVNAPSTTAVGAVINLRMTASGSVVVASPMIATAGCGLIGTQVAQQGTSNWITFPDGMELSGTMQIGISQQGIAAAGFHVTLIAYEY